MFLYYHGAFIFFAKKFGAEFNKFDAMDFKVSLEKNFTQSEKRAILALKTKKRKY